MDLIEEFNNNFWKFTITAFFIVVIVFYIRWTRCLCKITDILSNHSAIQENFDDSSNKNNEQEYTDKATDLANQETAKKQEYTDKATDLANQETAKKQEYTDKATDLANQATAKKQEYTDKATDLANQETAKKQEYTDKATDLANQATAKKQEYTDKATDLAKKLSGNHKIDISGMFNSSKPSIPDVSNLISLGESNDDNKSGKINKLKNMFDKHELTKAQKEAREEERKEKQKKIHELKKKYENEIAKLTLTPISKDYLKAKETFTSNINSSCISNNTGCGKDCDIRSPENVIAQYKNIDSLLQGCKGPYIGGETVVVKDKITGGNMCLHSKEQPTYASVDNWHM